MADISYTYVYAGAGPTSPYTDAGLTKLNDATLASTATSAYVGWQSLGAGWNALFTIDLGSVRNVGEVFLYYARGGSGGVASPAGLQYEVSADGVAFEVAGSIVPSLADAIEGAQPSIFGGVAGDVRMAKVDIGRLGVRFIRVSAKVASSWIAISGVRVFDALFKLAGMATLDTGAAASYVLVRNWTTHAHVGLVVPAVNGAWERGVAEGTYDVTVVGPSGYQPITHGPIAAVAI